MCYVTPRYGPHLWELAAYAIEYPQSESNVYNWFAKELLEGKVIKELEVLKTVYSSSPEPTDEGADAYQGDDARRCASEGECDDEEAVDAGLEEESVLLEDGVVRVDSSALSGGAVEYVELCDCGKGCAGGEDEVACYECHFDCFLEERSCICSEEMLLFEKGGVITLL